MERLKRRWQFTQTYRDGIKINGRFMVVFLKRGEGEGRLRLGITATRKVGGAVTRNRCRRRVRALGELVGERILAGRVDVVVNVRRELAGAPWRELVAEFSRCLEKGLRRLGGHE